MRPWNIEEQSVEVEGTKWLVEFTSAHTEALKNGEAAPDHDQHVEMRIWNETRNRYMLLEFERGGTIKRTSVEAAGPATSPERGEPVTPIPEPSDPPEGMHLYEHIPASLTKEWDENGHEGLAGPATF